ncbi:MAG: carboxypeptidase-like regulatory domain-containing protein [Cyclobacteriaceae bacterium]
MSKLLTILTLTLLSLHSMAGTIKGVIKDENGQPLAGVLVFVQETSLSDITDHNGQFSIEVEDGTYKIATFLVGYKTNEQQVNVTGIAEITTELYRLSELLDEVVVSDISQKKEAVGWLDAVSGTGIYEAKKSEVIVPDQMVMNKAANVSRQIYGRVPGLNIWESDGAGVQLGIGGRGLNPNRTSNFNVRQNGYDIAADALGYPESYYTPPVQAVERIELIRGAASLQYGTQFGGMLNFIFKQAPLKKSLDLNLSQSIGSFGLYNSFVDLGVSNGKVGAYGFYHFKHSDGWRSNSTINQHTSHASVRFQLNPLASFKVEHTHMNYLAQQPGGLTDFEFNQNPRQSIRDRNWFDVRWDISSAIFDYRFNPKVKINNRVFMLNAHKYALGNLGRIDRPDDPDSNRDLMMDEFLNWGNELRLMYHYKLLGKSGVLLAGNRIYQGNTLRTQGEGDHHSEPNFYLSEQSLIYSDYRLPSKNVASFIENVLNVSDQFSITPGIRLEYINTQAKGYYFERSHDLAGNLLSEEKKNEDKFKKRSFVLLGVGFSYKTERKMELYSNFSQNFRAINFNDIRVVNPSLKVDPEVGDERGYNVDLGARGTYNTLIKYDMSIFYLSYQDRIGSVLKSEPDPRFNYLVDRPFRYRTNIANAGIKGIEFYFESSLDQFMSIDDLKMEGFINLAYIQSNYVESQEPGIKGNDVEMVPALNAKSGFNIGYQDLNVSLLFTHVSKQYSDASNALQTPTAVEGIIPSYHVLDLSMSLPWRSWIFETGINNLSDQMYFTRRAAGYPGPGIIPSSGRSFYLTINWHLSKD